MSTLYKDSLIEMTDQEIVFQRYYFPFGGEKRLPWSRVEGVQIKEPSFFGGRWRLWGTGNFRTWYPQDNHRPSRDRIFLLSLRDSVRHIGFTVEDSPRVTSILQARGIVLEIPPA